MTAAMMEKQDPLDILNRAFLLNYPKEAARKFETMLPEEAAFILNEQPLHILTPVWNNLAPGVSDSCFLQLREEVAADLLMALDARLGAVLLSRFDQEQREYFLNLLKESAAKELRELLSYPDNSAGRLMGTNIIAFNRHITIADAIAQLKNQKIEALHHLYILDDNMCLCGQIDMQRLVLADSGRTLSSLSVPVTAYVTALDPQDEAIEKLEHHRVGSLPVVDGNNHLVGVIHSADILDAIKENLASEIQTMVGVSKDERANSTSVFAVRKRLPWLEINLLTAFLAAAVVGIFEDTIARFTALAIMLPVVAGQSGNAGAQALAVTMRGLTLREITPRDWIKVTLKEAGTGVINGSAIAVTCAAGVYLWSKSPGLSLVIAVSMVISMTIAGIAGALVPIVLKRVGLDPAQSSSIVLTTVTDIAGFMSFLGIATLLSSMLTPG
ncbi:MAG: magnesium transporter [SAR324 cluster bacterium]|nr:magnesium transporter [SAR324 cluster bacterium]